MWPVIKTDLIEECYYMMDDGIEDFWKDSFIYH